MGNIRKKHSVSFKAKVALDLIKGTDTIATVSSRYAIHPTQAAKWKDRALKGLELSFSNPEHSILEQKDHLIEELYKEIGQLKVELDWLKKKVGAF